MNDCGLSEKVILKIWGVLAQYAEVEKAILYGSRAKGNYRNGSDIDITLEGDKLTDSIRGKIDMDLDDLLLPYGIDLSIFEHLNHAKLRNHIERVGVTFYDKSTDKKKVGWKMVKLGDVAKLGDVCLVHRGTTITKKQTVSGDIPVIAGGTKPAYFHNQANRNANVITVSGSGANAGFVNYWDMPIFASDCATIEPKDKTQDRKFILYYLLSQQQYIYDNFRSGAAQPHVYAKDIATLSYPIIPISHQRQIVAKLDKIFAEIETVIVATRQKRIEFAKLKAATLSTCLSPNGDEWKVAKLGDVCEIVSGGTPDSQNGAFWGGSILWITPKDMGKLNKKWTADTSKKITEEGLNNSSAKLIPKNSIILSSRAPIGHLAINLEEMSFNQGCRGLIPKSNLNNLYLYYFLLKSKKLLNDLGRGATFKEISKTALASVEIVLPPISHQRKIVAKLDKVFAEIETADNASQEAEQNYTTLKKSILAEVFSKISDGI